MSTFGKVDPSTLGWVKGEIDETLKQARLALESFAENPTDKTRLRFCITHLHQVVGTLTMVELDGAAMLARETEQFAEAVLNDKLGSANEVLDTLTRAIVTLPDYLARLQYGQADAPYKYIPLINEMRRARGIEEVSELELFTPDLGIRPPADMRAQNPQQDDDYRNLARSLRPTLQTGLLNWLRDTNNVTALAEIGSVLDRLRDQASFGPHEQLFWIAGGLIEALTDGLEPSPERKKLFARLDQQIKRLVDGAEKSELRKNAEAIVRALLWEVGHSPTRGARATQLRQAFDLNAFMPGSASALTFEMPAPEVLNSVANALGAEVISAQDLLTTYFDPANRDPQVLQQLLDQLEKMASALDMLGVPPLKKLVDEIGAAARALLDGVITDPEVAAMPLAEALLALESGAHEVTHTPHEWSRSIEDGIHRLRALHVPGEGAPNAGGIEVGEAELTETEFKQLLHVVAGEVGVNLSKIEEAIESFAADTTRRDLMQDVPGLLAQIQGTMQILGQDPAAALVEETRTHVENIIAGTLAPMPAIMDALAVCVGTIGAYMEGLHTDRRNLDALIEGAHQDMQSALAGGRPAAARPKVSQDLERDLESWLEAPEENVVLRGLRAALESRAHTARAQGEERFARIADETDRLLQLVTEDAEQLTPEVVQTLRQSMAALVAATVQMQPEFEAEVEAPAPIPAITPRVVSVEPVDEEIREIFIEDARDVLATMARYYTVWRDNKEDKEAFAELRRGFHTLKGSGRMVNAEVIAEFSWAVENLLNRMRDGKIAYSREIVDLVGEAQTILPQMVDHYAGGPEPTLDGEPLRLRAQELAQAGPARAVSSSAPASANAAGVTFELPKLDGTLLEIFTNEANGHLEYMRREIASYRAEGARLPSELLFRSTHTLAGNARSLGIQMMSEACHETEKMLQGLRTQGVPLDEANIDLIERLYEAVNELVERLNRGEKSSGDLGARLATIARDARATVRSGDAPDTSAVAMAQADSVEEIELPSIPEPPRATAPASPAARPAAAPVARAKAALPEVDPELLEIFHEEAGEILNMLDASLARLRAHAGDRGALADFKRGLHTLKGGGRMAGVLPIGDLAHVTEGLLKRVEDGHASLSPEMFDLFDEVHDVFLVMLDRIEQGQASPSLDGLYAKMARAAPGLAIPQAGGEAVAEIPADAAPTETLGISNTAFETPVPVAAAAVFGMPASMDEQVPLAEVADDRRELTEDESQAFPDKMDRRGQIKVRTALLNELVNFAGEVSISRARMEQQVHTFRDNLGELSRNVVRFRDQIRELEIQSESQILYRLEQQAADMRSEGDFDPLEFDRFSRLQQLTRGLAESLHDLSTIQNNMGNFVGEAETALQQQARLNTELQEGLMRTRMVSFDTIAARLRHIVRTTARELDKRADLDLQGTDVELDRTVLERMIGPFEHMIRNSLDHGIELPDVRRKQGKPASGKIVISVAQEGSEIVIRLSDDGAGLNIDAIRKKAVERGLMMADANLADDELIQFILMPGFSTAVKITHVSGRGVGMDVVHTEVKQLGGSMAVDTQKGAGAAFVIRLPLTLSITQALMCHVGDQLFAVPLATVVNIVEFPIERLNSLAVGKNPLLEWQGQVYPYMHLGHHLGVVSVPRSNKKVPVLLTRAGAREIAIQVDGLGGTREVVIKSLGPQLAELKGLAGATILGDGRVVLILDLPGLWYSDEAMHLEARHHIVAPTAKPKSPVHERPVIMVVDDSLTVRKVTSKYLQKRGMEALTAKDGQDAVDQLRDHVPDLMLVDIEMPRMDGYELTQRVRSEARLKHVPIIMITSRAGAKHRQKAFELGVDMYMSKPYQEDELFKNIEALLLRARTAG